MSIQVFSARSSPQLQSKTITPSVSTQYVIPSTGYDGLSQVTVNGSSNLVSSNIKNGVNIFGVMGNYKGAEKHSVELSWTSSQETVEQLNLNGYGTAYSISVILSIPYSFTTSYLPLAYAVYINLFDYNLGSFMLYACNWDITYIESNQFYTEMASGNCVIVWGGATTGTTLYYGIDTGISILNNGTLLSSTLDISWMLPPNTYSKFTQFSSLQRTAYSYFYM